MIRSENEHCIPKGEKTVALIFRDFISAHDSFAVSKGADQHEESRLR